MKILALFLLSSLVSTQLFSNCNSYFALGAKNNRMDLNLQTPHTLLWQKKFGQWSLREVKNTQEVQCDEKEGYFLFNNDKISYETTSQKVVSYKIKRGWNKLKSHEDGVNIAKTFKNNAILFVYVYDLTTKAWALYSPRSEIRSLAREHRLLELQSIEPNLKFYVYANKSLNVKIAPNKMNETCLALSKKEGYLTLVDSGLNSNVQKDETHKISLASRYAAHYRRGVYNGTRVALIYPKIDVESNNVFRYGPAIPKAQLSYPKEYEEKIFYMFDYKFNKCYEGVFPSMKVPPFGMLKELK